MTVSRNDIAKHLAWLNVGPEAAALLACLHHEAFADASRDLWSENDFAQILALPTTVALIALMPRGETGDDREIPAGFVIFTQVLDESEILTLGVMPAQRKTGIGHCLVQAVLKRITETGITSLFLEVREDNEAARHLYERHGFSLAGRRKDYYQLNDGQRVDAVIMRKNCSS